MKKNILIGILAVIVFSLTIFLISSKKQINDYIEINNDLEQDILLEQEVPNVNNKAAKFLQALHKGEQEEYLTGDALKNYNEALKLQEDNHEDYHEDEMMKNFSQDLKIYLSNTQKVDDTLQSKVMYQLLYKGTFDNESLGVIDQRVYTMVANVKWAQDGDTYKVDYYSINLIDDFIGDEINEVFNGENE